jgi:transcription-repair coupling factor (superfamily II helicase)
MRDLEIRGAGDILGARQHGHMAAVGFHLYTRLLAEAVKRVRENKGLPLDKSALAMRVFKPLVTVDLPIPTNIPPEYIQDRSMRLGLYRRIADIQTLDEIEELKGEFIDRFGPLPEPVENLFYQMMVKILAIGGGFISVSIEGKQLILRYPQGTTPPPQIQVRPEIRIGRTALWVQIPEEKNWSTFLIDILEGCQLLL